MLNNVSDKDVIKFFYMSQGLLAVVAIILYLLFINDFSFLLAQFHLNILDILIYGAGTALVVVLLNIVMDRTFPASWSDDGGINERVFQALSVDHIFFAMLVVACVEELLFRGIIQTQFGLVISSLLFGFVHIRYIKKPLLIITALILGFYLGWLFIVTDNLLVPISAHYLIDVCLGIVLKYQISKQNKEVTGDGGN